MVESYKYKSRIATAISFLAALIAYIGKDGLTQIMPSEYANLVPIIIFCAGYVLTQTTENKRVAIAEELVLENVLHQPEEIEDIDPASEYEKLTGDQDGC